MNIQKLKNRFYAVSGAGKRQTAFNAPLDPADITTHEGVSLELTVEKQRETVYDCSGQDISSEDVESRLRKAAITFSIITAQIIARELAYFLGAAAAPTLSGAFQKHALTRSTNDDLPKVSFISGFEDDEISDPQEYQNFVSDSLVINLNRRKNVTVTVNKTGSFPTIDATGYEVPECVNPPALKGRDCAMTIGGVDYTAELWQASINLNNNVPTGDDAFPFDSADISLLERGDKPTYRITAQIFGYRGDALYTLADNETKVPVTIRLGGLTDEHDVLTFPAALVKLAATPTVFVGELNRTAINLEITPHKDAVLRSPLKADAYLMQSVAFLEV